MLRVQPLHREVILRLPPPSVRLPPSSLLLIVQQVPSSARRDRPPIERACHPLLPSPKVARRRARRRPRRRARRRARPRRWWVRSLRSHRPALALRDPIPDRTDISPLPRAVAVHRETLPLRPFAENEDRCQHRTHEYRTRKNSPYKSYGVRTVRVIYTHIYIYKRFCARTDSSHPTCSKTSSE